MSATAERIRSEAFSLSSEERAELAHFLIRSLDPASDSESQAEWDAELERRGEEIRQGVAVGIPAEQVFDELRARLK
ncbi:addiction module protein [Haloferula sp. BvORR071]|uniref:addiction module protein n=1 Tax=Haloferula sp. BvORR071 TaxID=1396141 RepID=UPI0005506073|nr:addiction module protein [Haloferula sp. BvORR071]